MGKKCKCLVTSSHLPSVASKHVYVRKNPVLIGCKHDMFCHQTFEVWSIQQNILLQVFLGIKNNF